LLEGAVTIDAFFESHTLNRAGILAFEVDLQHEFLGTVKSLFYRLVQRVVFLLQKMHGTQDIDIAFVGLDPPQKALVLRARFTGDRKEHEQKQQRKTHTDDAPGL
jgi:hypothetical protein